jgi:hypothetical protein
MKMGEKEAQRRALRERAQSPRKVPRPMPPAVPGVARGAPVVARAADAGGMTAPPGECPYCDRRRARIKAKVAKHRADKK